MLEKPSQQSEQTLQSREYQTYDFPPEIIDMLHSREAEVLRFEDKYGNEAEVLAWVHEQKLPAQLPKGYCYIGGVARNVALQELGEHVLPPRDLDITAIDELDPDLTKAEELTNELMPEDARRGGYQITGETIGDYFTSRDFNVNQVLVAGNVIIAHPEALVGLHAKSVRPTSYEQTGWEFYELEREGVSPKLVFKALRLQIEFEEMYGYGTISGIEDWQFESPAIHKFYLSLGLDKAIERGDTISQLFFENLIKHGVVARKHSLKDAPFMANSPEELAVVLRWKMREDGRNPFRFTNPENNQTIKEFSKRAHRLSEEDEYEYLQDLADAYKNKTRGVPKKERHEGLRSDH